MSVGIEAAQIRLAQLHQDLPGGHGVARVLQVIGLADRIGVEIVRVAALPAESLAERLAEVGLEDVRFFPLTLGIATLYVGKKPASTTGDCGTTN